MLGIQYYEKLKKNFWAYFIAELGKHERPPSRAPYSYGREKDTHQKFSHGYHGWRYCSWARTHDHDGDGDGDGVGVAQDGGHIPANRLTETCILGLWRKDALFTRREFERKENSILQTIVEFTIGLTEAKK